MKLINGNKSASSRSSRHESTRSKTARTLARRTAYLLLASALALCGGSVTTYAQTPGPVWEPANDSELVAYPSANAGGIAADSLGNLFVAGSFKDAGGTTHGIVRQSTDKGTTWFTATEIPGAVFERISSRENVTVAVAAYGMACLIRQSTDGGATWSDLVTFTHPNPNYSRKTIWDVELDPSGNIYVVTEYEEKTATVDKRGNVTYHYISRPVILKREAGVWITIAPPFALTKVVCFGSDIFSTGDPGSSWKVRKSSDGGHNWSLLESFIFENGARATDIAVDGNGNLFVCGTGHRTVIVRRNRYEHYPFWIVRKGTFLVGAWQWDTTDSFRIGPERSENQATALTIDSNNHVHVTGRVGVDGLDRLAVRWMTRQYSPSPETGVWEWKTTDYVDLGPEFPTHGNRIGADPFGSVFAKGGNYFGDGWIVRRKLAPPAP